MDYEMTIYLQQKWNDHRLAIGILINNHRYIEMTEGEKLILLQTNVVTSELDSLLIFQHRLRINQSH